MAKDFLFRNAGSNEPRLVGSIITEMLLGNSPLAQGYRKHLASIERSAEKGGEL